MSRTAAEICSYSSLMRLSYMSRMAAGELPQPSDFQELREAAADLVVKSAHIVRAACDEGVFLYHHSGQAELFLEMLEMVRRGKKTETFCRGTLMLRYLASHTGYITAVHSDVASFTLRGICMMRIAIEYTKEFGEKMDVNPFE